MIRPIPKPPYLYSLKWAAGVVDQLVSKYARASEIVCQAYGINTYTLVKYLAKPDYEWNWLKARIKYLDTWMWETRKEPDNPTLVEWLGLPRPTKISLNRLTGLDSYRDRAKLGERGSGGGGGARAAPCLPFTPQEIQPSKHRVAPRERYLVRRAH